MTRGVYVLVIRVQRAVKLRVGRNGEARLSPGQYLYVGSAMGTGSTSIENRLRRHFSDHKTIHWHIDYLLCGGGKAVAAVWGATDKKVECELARTIESCPNVTPSEPGFGCSDCRGGCRTHLFRFAGRGSAVPAVRQLLLELGLEARVSSSEELHQPETVSKC